MQRLIIIFFFILTLANISYSKTWININNDTVRLTKDTRCETLTAYENTACECRLVQDVLINKLSFLTAVETVSRRSKCTFDGKTLTNEDAARALFEKAKNNLRIFSIVNIDKLVTPMNFSKEGLLTEDNVAIILKALYKTGYLTLPATFFNEDHKVNPLKISVLDNNAKGVNSGQLFRIRFDPYFTDSSVLEPGKEHKPLYILKETKKGMREIKNLFQIDQSNLRGEKVSTHEKVMQSTINDGDQMAEIAFDDVHFKISVGGKVRYFSFLQTAPGQSLHRHLDEFGKLATESDRNSEEFKDSFNKIKHIFFRIGYAMSLLHQKYSQGNPGSKMLRRTYMHGDLHSDNIFFDEVSDRVTLIDNETFALSLKHPDCGVNDIVELYLLHTVHTIAHRFSGQLKTNRELGIDDQLWHELWQELFHGYLLAYGPLSDEEFSNLYKDFRREFFGGYSDRSFFKSIRNITDQRKLKRLGPSLRRRHIRQHELRDIFDHSLMESFQGENHLDFPLITETKTKSANK